MALLTNLTTSGPLSLRTIFAGYFSGSDTIFIAVALCVLAIWAASFRMMNSVFFMLFVLFLIVFSSFYGFISTLLVLVAIVAALIGLRTWSKVVDSS